MEYKDNIMENRYAGRKDKATANNIDEYLEAGEVILWEGKPDRNTYIKKCQGIPFFFVAIWCMFDLTAFAAVIASGDFVLVLGVSAFLAVHMAPVWIYLYGKVKGHKTVNAITYYITNQRCIVENTRNQLKYNYIKHQDIVSVKTDQTNYFKVIGSITIQSAVFKLDFSCVEYYTDIAQLINDTRHEAEANIRQLSSPTSSSKQNYKCEYCGRIFQAKDSKCPSCGARAHMM